MKSLELVRECAVWKALRTAVRSFARDRSGSVAVMAALAMPVLIGVTGLGVEVSYWYLTQRSMQNAADSAAIAAATNGTANYSAEAQAAAAKYGYVHGANNISVTASNTAPCPSGGANCYSATITGYVPLFLSQVVGYRGTATVGGSQQTMLSARAVARLDLMPREYCILALGTSGIAFGTNGAPKADLTGCSIMSNAGAPATATIWAPITAMPRARTMAAAWSSGRTCRRLPTLTPDWPRTFRPIRVAATTLRRGTKATAFACATNTVERHEHCDRPLRERLRRPGVGRRCHDPTPAEGTVLVIWNGQLYTGKKPNGHTLSTDSGSALTIVFTGTRRQLHPRPDRRRHP